MTFCWYQKFPSVEGHYEHWKLSFSEIITDMEPSVGFSIEQVVREQKNEIVAKMNSNYR